MPHVKGHYRKGRWVSPHYRRSPGRSLSVGVIVAVILVLLIIAI